MNYKAVDEIGFKTRSSLLARLNNRNVHILYTANVFLSQTEHFIDTKSPSKNNVLRVKGEAKSTYEIYQLPLVIADKKPDQPIYHSQQQVDDGVF